MDWSCWQPKHLTQGLSWQHAFIPGCFGHFQAVVGFWQAKEWNRWTKKTFAAWDFHSSPHQQKNNTSNTPTMSQAPFIQMEPLLSSAKGIYHGLKQDQGLCDKWFSGLKKFWTWTYHFLNICGLKVPLPLHSQSVLTHNMFPLQQFYWSLHCRSFSKKPSSLPTIGAPHKEGSGLGALMNHLHSGSDPLSNLDISSIHTNICCHLIRKYQIILKVRTLSKPLLIFFGHWVQTLADHDTSSLCQGASNWHLQALAFQYHRGRLHEPNLIGKWRVREKNGY